MENEYVSRNILRRPLKKDNKSFVMGNTKRIVIIFFFNNIKTANSYLNDKEVKNET